MYCHMILQRTEVLLKHTVQKISQILNFTIADKCYYCKLLIFYFHFVLKLLSLYLWCFFLTKFFLVLFFNLQAVKEYNGSLPHSVDRIMSPWVLQMGFPVVTINTAIGKVSQKHFLLDADSNVTVKSPYKYAELQLLKCKYALTHCGSIEKYVIFLYVLPTAFRFSLKST